MRIHASWPVAAVLLAACGSGGGGGPDSFATPQENGIEVEVENNSFERATIWYETLGRRQRLGIVEGKTTQTLPVDNWPLAAPIFLEIHMTGGGNCRTSEIMADPGDVLYLQVSSAGITVGCG